MNLAEMIDATLAEGGHGEEIVEMMIEYGHLPKDANVRPAGETAREIAAFQAVRDMLHDAE